MNNAGDNFVDMLRECPFDGSPRAEHRRAAVERAMREYDAAAAEASGAAAESRQTLPVPLARRPLVRHAIAAALAASLGAALAYWYVRPDGAPSPEQLQAAAQAAALEQAHRELAAALRKLREFEHERAVAFALGVQACLGEHDSQMAALRAAPLNSTTRAAN